jgi:uncharacterized integral membrane protein
VAEDESGRSISAAVAASDGADDSNAIAPTAQAPGEVEPAFQGTGVSVALVIGVVVTVLAIIVAVQNTDDVGIDFLAWDVDAPLVAVILAAAVAGVLFDEILGFFWRRRRRHHLAERAELRRLRRR